MFKFSNQTFLLKPRAWMMRDRGKRKERDRAKRAAETKKRDNRDWIDGTDDLVYIFYAFLLCSVSVVR